MVAAALAICASAFAFGFVGSMPLAGPIAVMVVSRAASRRFSEALHIGLGAALAEGIYAGVAFWGFTSLFARTPLLAPISHGVTAVVLAVLGARFVFWSPKKTERKRAASNSQRAGTTLVGFSISAINPTLLVTWGAIVAFLYSKGLSGASSLVAVPFGACAAAGVAIWFVVLVALLRKYEGNLPHGVLTWTIRGLGLALVVLGMWSAVRLVDWLHGNRAAPAHAVASVCFDRAADRSLGSVGGSGRPLGGAEPRPLRHRRCGRDS